VLWSALWPLPPSEAFANADLFEGQPAIAADGTIYASVLSGGLMAIAPSGTILWSVVVGYAWFGPSPTIAIARDGCVYVNMNELWALNPADGTIAWEVSLGNGGYAPSMGSSAAVGADGTIHVSGLFAVHPGGALDWKHPELDLMSTPAVGPDGRVATIDSVGRLHGLGANGAELWSAETHEAPPNGTPGEQGVSTEAWMSPVIGPDGTIYVATTTATTTLYAVATDGTIAWQYEFEGDFTQIEGAAAIGADGTLYVAYGDLYAFDPRGNVKWRAPSFGGTAPILDGNGTVFATNGRTLGAIRPDGTTAWTYPLVAPPTGMPSLGADGTIYVPIQKQIWALGASH
jgi:outer membrane protein assembly factor BamB